MRDLSQLSGPWVGFWVQRGIRGSMGLALTFESGQIHGSGSDLVGAFRLSGAYRDDGSVSIVKTYAWHLVDYKGRWDGQMISGSWKIKYEGTGPFEIWPEADAFEISSLFELETREMVSS